MPPPLLCSINRNKTKPAFSSSHS